MTNSPKNSSLLLCRMIEPIYKEVIPLTYDPLNYYSLGVTRKRARERASSSWLQAPLSLTQTSLLTRRCLCLGPSVIGHLENPTVLRVQSNNSLGQIHHKELNISTNRFIWEFSIIFSLNIAIGKNVSLRHVSVNFNQVMYLSIPQKRLGQKYPWRVGRSDDENCKNSVDLELSSKAQDISSDEESPVDFVVSPLGFVHALLESTIPRDAIDNCSAGDYSS